MANFSPADLKAYKSRNPALFPNEPKPPKPPKHPPNGFGSEAQFQAAVIAELSSRFGLICKEGPKGSAGGGKVFYSAGWPDLTVFAMDGRRIMFFLELKQPGNGPSDEQLKTQDELRQAGFTAEICYNMEQCLEIAALELNECPDSRSHTASYRFPL